MSEPVPVLLKCHASGVDALDRGLVSVRVVEATCVRYAIGRKLTANRNHEREITQHSRRSLSHDLPTGCRDPFHKQELQIMSRDFLQNSTVRKPLLCVELCEPGSRKRAYVRVHLLSTNFYVDFDWFLS